MNVAAIAIVRSCQNRMTSTTVEITITIVENNVDDEFANLHILSDEDALINLPKVNGVLL